MSNGFSPTVGGAEACEGDRGWGHSNLVEAMCHVQLRYEGKASKPVQNVLDLGDNGWLDEGSVVQLAVIHHQSLPSSWLGHEQGWCRPWRS